MVIDYAELTKGEQVMGESITSDNIYNRELGGQRHATVGGLGFLVGEPYIYHPV